METNCMEVKGTSTVLLMHFCTADIHSFIIFGVGAAISNALCDKPQTTQNWHFRVLSTS